MKLFNTILLVCVFFSSASVLAQVVDAKKAAKPQNTEALNKVDGLGRRTGLWLIFHAEHMGDAAYYEFGHYDAGRKTGEWYKVDEQESLIAMENFRNDVLNGEVKYFDHGLLSCTGHYRGLNTANRFDTLDVINPETDMRVQRIISTDRGTLRHGTWKYYDETTGAMVKEEEYQVDSLIYRKEFAIVTDSTKLKEREKQLPHNKRAKYKPPLSKQYSYLKQD